MKLFFPNGVCFLGSMSWTKANLPGADWRGWCIPKATYQIWLEVLEEYQVGNFG